MRLRWLAILCLSATLSGCEYVYSLFGDLKLTSEEFQPELCERVEKWPKWVIFADNDEPACTCEGKRYEIGSIFSNEDQSQKIKCESNGTLILLEGSKT